ncbi:MAG: class I SAM-dependent DNA methyltransferase, partial [Spirochaetota bacterium]
MTNEELKQLEDNLWSAADKLRANSGLKSSEYSTPILGLIFLKFADNKYSLVEEDIKAELQKQKNSRRQREEHEIALEKCGFYLPEKARYDYLLNLPEEEDFDKAIRFAMEQIEKYKPELKDTLPKDEFFELTRTDKSLLKDILRTFSDIPKDAKGDLFGKIYEYFLGKFALAEGQGGGEFFTPSSVVQLIVEIIEPYKGKIYDPASGSGGMFVQSSKFINKRRAELKDSSTKEFVAYGQEKTLETVKLDKMNLAVNGIDGDIRQANSYTEDPFDSLGRFDYVMANPPFNVDEVALESVKDSPRFNAYGIPQNKSKAGKKKGVETVPNANYLWINLFASSLNDTGRAGFVMANSASDARHSELEIRKNLIDSGILEVMLTLPSNMFYTVTLPATLWFFNKGKK